MLTLKEQLAQLMLSGKIPVIATQQKVSFPVIERMYKKIKLGIIFPTIRIHENAIIEGHHRYLAYLLAQVSVECGPGLRSSAKENIAWTNVQILDDDYYTDVKIRDLSEEDAKYLGINVDELLERIK